MAHLQTNGKTEATVTAQTEKRTGTVNKQEETTEYNR